jgi:hypothetical protein
LSGIGYTYSEIGVTHKFNRLIYRGALYRIRINIYNWCLNSIQVMLPCILQAYYYVIY